MRQKINSPVLNADLVGEGGGVHEQKMQDWSWKGFKAENTSYSSGSSSAKTETRYPTQRFQPATASCQGAEAKDTQYSAVVRAEHHWE